MKGVYEKDKGSKVWWIHYYDAEGRRRREKVGRKGAAIKLYSKRKTEALEGRKLPESLRQAPTKFSEIARYALEYSRKHKRSFGDDEIRMKKLVEEFGERSADSIGHHDIERFLDSHLNWKPATSNRYRALLSLAYRLAIANGKVKSNPARLVRPRKENNARIRYLSEGEESRLRLVIQEKYPHHLPDFVIALNTGLRLSEQYGLTWNDVDFDQRIVTVGRSKNGEIRHVRLNDSALAAFRQLKHAAMDKDYVFLNRYGTRASGPKGWFAPAVRDAKVPKFTWHCLRHSFASYLTMAGAGARELQEAMGHKTIQMTMRYSHLAPEHQLAVVQLLCDTGSARKAATASTTATSAGEANLADEARVN